MTKTFEFAVDARFDPLAPSGMVEGEVIRAWLLSRAADMADAAPGEKDFAALSERLLLEGRKDLLVWDDLLKAAEMTYYADQTPLVGPSLDLCCGYAFWTSRILGKIDLGVDLFPREGAFRRSLAGFVENGFIGGAYRAVLRADVTGEMPLPNDFFQSVVSVCALEHLDRADRTLAAIAKALKPGGKAYLSLQTRRYIETFAEIFHPDYVRHVREAFSIHVDRSWREWIEMAEAAGLRVLEKRFVLDGRQTALKALAYWKDPFHPVLGDLGLEDAVKEIPELRRRYYAWVRRLCESLAEPDDAAIVCLTCERSR